MRERERERGSVTSCTTVQPLGILVVKTFVNFTALLHSAKVIVSVNVCAEYA